jgi:hypothetical protein
MKNFFLFLLIIFISHFSFSQKRNNIWMLGGPLGSQYPKFGLDFNSGTVDTFSLVRDMNFYNTNAGMCDTSGQLLFYTNGNYVATGIMTLF